MRQLQLHYDSDPIDLGPAPPELREAARQLVTAALAGPEQVKATVPFDGPPCPDFEAPALALLPWFRPLLVVSHRPGVDAGSYLFEDGLASCHTLALSVHPIPGSDPWDWPDDKAAGRYDVAISRWVCRDVEDPCALSDGPRGASDAELALVIAAAGQLSRVKATAAKCPAPGRPGTGGRRTGRRGRAESWRERRAAGRRKKALREARALLPRLARGADGAGLALAQEMIGLLEQRAGQMSVGGRALAAAAIWLAEPGDFLGEVAGRARADLLDTMIAHSELHEALWLPDKDPVSRRVAQCLRDQEEREDLGLLDGPIVDQAKAGPQRVVTIFPKPCR